MSVPTVDMTTQMTDPHGLNCRPEPCEGVADAMSASRVACKVVWFIVKQRQLHANICNGDAAKNRERAIAEDVGNMPLDS